MNLAAFMQLVALSALWGASFLFIRIASPLLGPTVLAGARVGMATLALTALMLVLRQRWPWAQWRALLLIALLAVALPFLLFAWAGLHLPSSYSALINTLYVVFGCLFGAWLKVDTLNGRKLLGCLLGLIGIGLIVQLGPIQLTPTILLACAACTLAAACYGLATPLTKRALHNMEPLAVATFTHLGAFVLLLPLALPALPQARFTPAAIAIVGLLGVVTSGLAYWWCLRIMRHISNAAALSPAFMIPMFGVLWGHLFLSEPLSLSMLMGAALALVAVALISELKWSWGEQQTDANATP
jgi:drug/metabolite transporter (DMT)-like permease